MAYIKKFFAYDEYCGKDLVQKCWQIISNMKNEESERLTHIKVVQLLLQK